MVAKTAFLQLAELMRWTEEQTGCVVQFHDLAGVTLLVPQLQLPARWHYHHGPYCEFMKRQGCQSLCAAAKERSLAIARRRRRPFCGVCPQGVWDLVYPVEFNGQLAGVFYIGSLRRRPLAAVRRVAYAGPPLPAWSPDSRQRLEPFAQTLAGVMRLVLGQWQESGAAWCVPRSDEWLRQAVRAYIEANYHENIGLQQLAAQLNLHSNYLGQLIQRAFGQPFRQLLVEYRIEKAKVLLRDGNHSVTAAAYGSGFRDSNYFATVFRARVGETPRQYRQSRR